MDGDDIEFTGWRKSAHCGNSFSCVEAGSGRAAVGVRDSHLEASPVLVFGSEGWERFTAAVKSGTVAR